MHHNKNATLACPSYLAKLRNAAIIHSTVAIAAISAKLPGQRLATVVSLASDEIVVLAGWLAARCTTPVTSFHLFVLASRIPAATA